MKTSFYLLIIAATIFVACNPKEDLDPQTIEGENYTEVSVPDEYVTIEEAREELENLLEDFSTLSKSNGFFSSKKISNAFTLTSSKPSISKSSKEDTTLIHVFNFEDEGGFAIMAATRKMPSLLAITESGNLDTAKAIDNPGLIMFLNRLEAKPADFIDRLNYGNKDKGKENANQNNIDYVNTKGGYTVYSKYQNIFYNPKGGYCKVHWHQNSPFNNQCPVKYTKKTVVGCIAVACAQLMSIYQHPSKYKDTTLHWSQMLANENCPDIAWLMKKIGDEENLNMEYNIPDTGSSAYPNLIPRTLKNFGFSKGGVFKYYNTSTVCEDLKKGYPVLIGGCDTKEIKKVKTPFGFKDSVSYSGGHRWLAHGLLVRHRTITRYSEPPQDKLSKNTTLGTSWTESYEYVLCNFGWKSGRGNGYFLSGVFDVDDKMVYGESYSKSNNKTDYYQYELTTVTGIRK